jgi:C1A family cysteine protease
MNSATLLLVLALACFASCKVYTPRSAALSARIAFDEFNSFWNKTHKSSEERQMRFRNFVLAGHKIAQMNKDSKSATFGYTKFADQSPEEFKKMLGFRPATPLGPFPVQDTQLAAPSGAIDWVAKGKTTPVKNQEQCGSCWAFSTTETVESANLMAGNNMAIGAPQEIVDCDSSDQGCNGGDPREALGWVVNHGGLDTESCYPYIAEDESCMSSKCSPSPNLKISTVIPVAEDETQIYSQLQNMPLSICCDAEPWQYYNGGVLTASQCGLSIDHAIQLTGYSPEQGGYWIVRNSWGADWGENGYIYLQYGYDTCGITYEVTGANA